MLFDAIIVGGSYAGLSAALQLARARRKVLVMDEGKRRNRFTVSSHGFFGQDGRDPAAIVADARAELLAYPTVEWLDSHAVKAYRTSRGFTVSAANGADYEAKRLILATGIVDALPEIPGLAERWGRHVFHCPYCHGYELERGHVGVLATSDASMHHALLLPDWGSTTFFLNDAFVPDAAQLVQLHERGVMIEKGRIERITGTMNIVLCDGRNIALAGLFTLTHTHMASPLAEQLGCKFDEGPVGPYIKTDDSKETSVTGVFACGDAARPSGSVALAVGEGALAGIGTHQSLVFS